MAKLFLFLSIFLNLSIDQGEDLNNHIVELAKIYRNFMFRNSPTESTFKQLNDFKTVELAGSIKFIRETISSQNALATKEFLTLPSDNTLKLLYIIRRVNWNLREETPRDNNEVISELKNRQLSHYELIDCYYDMLFSGIGNKNQPFDLSMVNFEISNYGLVDDTEKGIFFLKAMEFCGITIWGYMNIVKPPNYQKTLENIGKFPKFNGLPYFQYLDFGFTDFDLQVEKDKEKESFKFYYINKYYDTLLSHLSCLSPKKQQKEAKKDLLLGSILKEKNYYKYSKKKEILESFFTYMER